MNKPSGDDRPGCLQCRKAAFSPDGCKCLSGAATGYRRNPAGRGWVAVTVGELRREAEVVSCNDEDGNAD